jgi:hypothetical protein
MKPSSPSSIASPRKLTKPRGKIQCTQSGYSQPKTISTEGERGTFPVDYEIRIICLYPSIDAAKMARAWLENALHHLLPDTGSSIEYYNYAVLNHDGISWRHVIGRIRPDIILMIGDGKNQLVSGFRHSLKELLAESCNGKKPLVIFRDLEPSPSINTSVLLDYVAALTDHNHCEFNAMDGNGIPIGCFRHPRLLLKTRRHHE